MAQPENTLHRISEHVKRGEAEKADSLLRVALARDRSNPEANYLATIVALQKGQNERALRQGRLAVRLDPHNGLCHNALGVALYANLDNEGAIAAYEACEWLLPGYPEAPMNRGDALEALGRYTEAAEAFALGVALAPDSARAKASLARVRLTCGQAEEAVEMVTAARDAAPADRKLQAIVCVALNYWNGAGPERIVAEHKRYGSMVQAARPARTAPLEKGGRLCVGYVSPDFRTHSVSYFMAPVLSHHDRDRFRVVCYSTARVPDDTTERLKGMVDAWRDCGGLKEAEVAARIQGDAVDILVDLCGHTQGSVLDVFALKPAPIQATYLGYPNTTGLPAMDWRIVDGVTDPPGAEARATERLMRLPVCFMCYGPPREAPEVAAAPPSRSAGVVTFGSFNSLAKFVAPVVEAWAAVLRAVPNSRLLAKAPTLSDSGVRDRFKRVFAERGVAPERIEMLWHADSLAEHLTRYGRVDVALDTFPYNGATTTCEALWMGVPVVALEGTMHAGRVGVSLLTVVGLSELIAPTVEDYVRIAAGLASDPERLASLRRGLRARMAASPLCDAAGFTKGLEAAYLEMARESTRRTAQATGG